MRIQIREMKKEMMVISKELVFLKQFLRRPNKLKEAIFDLFPGLITKKEWGNYYQRMVS
jgi:hypothetical protein